MTDNDFTPLDRLTECLASEFALVNATALAHRQGRHIGVSTVKAFDELMAAAYAALHDMFPGEGESQEQVHWNTNLRKTLDLAHSMVRLYVDNQKEDENMNTECAPLRDDDHHCCQGRTHGAHHDADCPRRQRVNFADRLSKLCAYVARLERMAADGQRVDMDQAVAKIDQLNAAVNSELASAVNPTRAQMTAASLRMALIGYVDELAKATTPALPQEIADVAGADEQTKLAAAQAVDNVLAKLKYTPLYDAMSAAGDKDLTDALVHVAAEALKAGLDQGR